MSYLHPPQSHCWRRYSLPAGGSFTYSIKMSSRTRSTTPTPTPSPPPERASQDDLFQLELLDASFENGMRLNSTSTSAFIEIRIPSYLLIPSKRPFHVAQRFRYEPVDRDYHLLHTALAQSRRETLLRQRRELCAKHVSRAKEIAKRHRKSVEESKESKKQQLEHRLRITESRREKLLNIPRTQHLSNRTSFGSTGEDMNPQLSSRRNSTVSGDKQAIKRRALEPYMQKWLAHGLSMQKASSAAFSDLISIVQNKSLVHLTGQVLYLLNNLLHGGGRKSDLSEKASHTLNGNPLKRISGPRVFLTAYLLVGQPAQILGPSHADHQELIDSAKQMLTDFERWLPTRQRPQSEAELVSFEQSWLSFRHLFAAWKARDASRIVDSMLEHAMEIETLYDTIIEKDMAPPQPIKQQIQRQRAEIRAQIQRLGGADAVRRLDSVLATIERERADRAAARQQADDNMSVLPSTDPAMTLDAALPKDKVPAAHRTEAHMSQNPSTASDTDQSAEAARILESLAAMPTENVILLHEIAVDPNFHLQKWGKSAVEDRVREVMTRAFFDSMREDFSQANYARWLPGLIKDIQERLTSLVPPRSSMQQTIQEVLDQDLITQQLVRNIFDVRHCLDFVWNTMAAICAPVRDEQVQELKAMVATADVVDQFKATLELLDEMNLDLANFQIATLRPFLTSKAQEYERQSFARAIQEQRIPASLPKTRAWLQKAWSDVQEAAAQRTPDPGSSADVVDSRFDHIHNEALVSYVMSTEPLNEANCPETLRLDLHRLIKMANNIVHANSVVTLVMLAKNAAPMQHPMRSDVDHECVKTLKDRLYILLQGNAQFDHLSSELEHALAQPTPNASFTLDEATISTLRSMVEKTISFRDPIYNLFSRRIHTALKHHVTTGKPAKQETLQSYGLGCLESELQTLGEELYRLGRYHRQVYASYLDAMLQELVS
ncbi:hypothetical protein BZG36_04213 [Bifiguratus adelaidae]|uniref:T-complex protein 11-domain-containing protein n=1 Tax=Bifiguratus adelaidae TaxID=1938954 RepID=A0A261XY89_9FUNG|nr:hypothetical protein BZG36_04213 [Bifiguratus adelaidae]